MMLSLKLSNQLKVTPEQEAAARAHAESTGKQFGETIGVQPGLDGSPVGVMYNTPEGHTYIAPIPKATSPKPPISKSPAVTPTLKLTSVVAARDEKTNIPGKDTDKVQIGMTDFPDYASRSIAEVEEEMLRNRPEWTNRQFLPVGTKAIPIADVSGISVIDVPESQVKREPTLRLSPRMRGNWSVDNTKEKKEKKSASLLLRHLLRTTAAPVPDMPDTSEYNVIRQQSFPTKFPEPSSPIPPMGGEGADIYKEFRAVSLKAAEIEVQVGELISAATTQAKEFAEQKEYLVLIAEKQRQLEKLRQVVSTYPEKLAHIEEMIVGVWPAHRQRSQTVKSTDFRDALITEFPDLKKRITELYEKVRSYSDKPEQLLLVDVSGRPLKWKGEMLSSLKLQPKRATVDGLSDLLQEAEGVASVLTSLEGTLGQYLED